MASALLAIGTSSTPSADFTVSGGIPITLCLTDADGGVATMGATVAVQFKCANGTYTTIGYLTGQNPSMSLQAAGTYRLVNTSGVSVGVDRN